MKLKEAIDALLNGGEIDDAARQQLRNFDPEGLSGELAALRNRLEEQENAQLSAEELLRKELAEVTGERDALKQCHSKLERRNLIRQICDDSGCTDPDYLDFLASREGIDLSDEAVVAAFIAGTLQKSPHCFRTRLCPGSGFRTIPESVTEETSLLRDRIGDIVSRLDSAPERH